MKIRLLSLLVLILTSLSGCLGSITSSTPPRFYQLDYSFKAVDCSHTNGPILRVWPLSATAPFDREQMIIINPSLQVRFSSQYRWVALPGQMIADRLLRDLSLDSRFGKVVSTGSPLDASLEMSGQVFKFSWEERDSSAHAILDLEINMWTNQPKREILFRKHYHLESQPVASGGSEQFAEAMSGLVKELSTQLREDLCSTPLDNSSPGAG